MYDNDGDDDEPKLSKETLLALQEFLEEQASQNNADIEEDWQLSQFWYDDDTIKKLSRAALSNSNDSSKIALISCPSLYKTVKSIMASEKRDLDVKLFEFDKRFSCYSPDFVFYDYNTPLSVDTKFREYFDVILVDPPFLSDECLSKTAQTVRYIGRDNCKIILCTGAVMESAAGEFLNVKKCTFEPKHKRNLANNFICLTNFGELEVG